MNQKNETFKISSAIAFYHLQKISHRDIKPANILINHDGRCILSDFGLSGNVMGRDKVNEFCGSLPYKPPEIIKRILYSPLKADIWSLGVTFYVRCWTPSMAQ
jgi:serine/threonine protein kinase